MTHNTPVPRDLVLHPAALAFAREGDVLVVTRLDRLARSLRQLLTIVDALPARGIGLRSLHERIDTTSATGRLILHIFASLGQFEVELLRERTRTALATSRARGRVGGRPPALNAIKVRAVVLTIRDAHPHCRHLGEGSRQDGPNFVARFSVSSACQQRK